jgi:hypothetical protein
MFHKTTDPVAAAREILRDEELQLEMQRYLVALVTVLEAEQKGHELNLTRAFREVILTTEPFTNP